MDRPVLKQFDALTPEDFERHALWVACHVADFDAPWWDETDEETFRPWSGPLPASPTDMLQPHVFVADRAYGFWGGIVGVPEDQRRAFLAAFGGDPARAFPIQFHADPGLAAGVTDVEVVGWPAPAEGQ